MPYPKRGGKMSGRTKSLKRARATVSQRMDKKSLDSIPGPLSRNPGMRNAYKSQWNTDRSGKGVTVKFKKRPAKKKK